MRHPKPCRLWNSTHLHLCCILGLTVDEKRVLEEFSGHPDTLLDDVVDSVALEGDAWQDLGQEGISQGFIDDIQGLLEGK